ncbi:hypothetical protein [Aliivibrio fischeri]|uniref:hypothetical protein n=1 Tax=Aliivibrio fischeri TaxID=668 RepID=UPI0003136A5B|nr:hypothetical protein [Aliivibrio fischeri]OED53570.1 hypothetical protein BEI46_17580 [Aliivibrio fischeri]OEE21667.1 hypothetical protein A1Q3_15315 [Aliivibrio fischeri ZF-211]
MKFGKFICMLAICTFSTSALSELEWHRSDWGKSLIFNENSADVSAYGKNDKGETTAFTVGGLVSLSKNNQQRIYFFVQYGEGKNWLNTCTQSDYEKVAENTYVKEKVWKINNQNIKMSTYCSTTPSGNYELSATPATPAGENFVKKQFMNSNDTVHIDNGDFNINMSAIGFMKVWNNYGGDAI